MKLHTLLLIFLLIGCSVHRSAAQVSSPGKASAPDPLRTLSRDELDVVKVLTTQEDAWNRGDLAAYASGYKNSPDDLFISQQVTRGYQAWLFDTEHTYNNRGVMGSLSFSGIEPHLLDAHYAVVVGQYHLDRTRKAGGPADGIFSLVMEKTEQGWKIIVDHTT